MKFGLKSAIVLKKNLIMNLLTIDLLTRLYRTQNKTQNTRLFDFFVLSKIVKGFS